MRSRGLVGLLVLLWSAPTFGWWDVGHRVIASIAFQRLEPEQRAAVLELLRSHPRWDMDFESPLRNELADIGELHDVWVVHQAAIWPDLARDLKGADHDRFHHATWHYVNQPLFLLEADRERLQSRLRMNTSHVIPTAPLPDMNIVQTIGVAQTIVKDRSQPAPLRAVMLCWLMHSVGDIHQPLHSTTLVSRRLFPDGCRGGNLIKTEQRGNLHALWDSLPGEQQKPRVAHHRALQLMADPVLRQLGEAAADVRDASSWLDESHNLAREVVFDAEIRRPIQSAEEQQIDGVPTIRLSEAYLRRAGRVAERRVVQAGYRIGAVLCDALK